VRAVARADRQQMLPERHPRERVRRRDRDGAAERRLRGDRVAAARFKLPERDPRVDVLRPRVDGERVRLRGERVAVGHDVRLAEAVERHREVGLVAQRAEVARLREERLPLLQVRVAHRRRSAVARVAVLAQ
jgi:hypothetical protein